LPKTGKDCSDARNTNFDDDVCESCDEDYKLDVATGTRCVLEPVEPCKCFNGGLAYQPGEAEFKIVGGERKKVEPCTKKTHEDLAGNACLSCKDGWEINQGRNNICKPKDDNCEISFYEQAGYQGKVCHLTWSQTAYWDRDGGAGYYRKEVDDIENFVQYQKEMCDWIRESGSIGSIKRDYKVLTDGSRPHGCKVRIVPEEYNGSETEGRIVDTNEEVDNLAFSTPIRVIREYQRFTR
jgi:hypothetical protein